MASGPVGEGDGTRERKRFKEGKVYTRKVFRGPKKTTSVGNTVASATATDKDDNAATTTITNDAETNTNRTDGAHSNTENVLAKLPAPQLEENLAQLEGSSRLVDGITALVQGSSKLQEGNSPRSQVNSRPEDGNSPQVSSRTKKDGNLPQQQLEDQNLAQPQASSRTEEDNSSQQQLEPQVTSPQPQADSRPEDGTSPQLQLDSRLEEGNLSQQQENLRLEEGNSSQQLVSSPQLQLDSRLEEGSLSQQQENLRLEEGNSSQQLVSSPQLQLDSRLEEGNLSQQQENLRLGEGNSSQQLVTSPQLQLDSRLEEGNLSQQQENLRLEEGNSSQQLVSSRLEEGNLAQPLTQSVSNDTQSGQQDEPSQQEKDVPLSPSHRQGAVPLVNGDVEPQLEDRIKINLSSTSKQEMQKLREKFEGELGVVRSLVRKIEVKQGRVGGYGTSNVLVGNRIANGGGAKRAHSEIASAGTPRQPTRPFHQFSLPMLENSQGISESVEKEKRMPKANQFYHNSEFLLAKDKFPPAESNKKSKVNWKKQGGGEMGYGLQMGPKFFKSCSSLLEKLMKHKHGWVFNSPVDVEGLGLHDYFTIITHPMDLGTVKTRLNKNWYKSPKEFAEDVRLTFHNAMTYNPKGQDVHVMAEQLSKIFEDRWAIIESDYNREMRYGIDYGAAPPGPSPLSRKVPPFPPPALDMRRILDRSESLARTPRPMSITPSSRTPAPKKPKAKDPHKRDMTFEEKQKLSTNLQSLPPEKLDAIVQIIKRRNFALDQHDDEIEVDIDSVDAETLWELDRFVTNYKKGLSKIKRRAELARARANSLQNATQQSQPPPMVGIPKETQADERNVPPSLPMQGGNQAYNRSRSSSSSSSSSDSGSSSSDSDSDSSSASGSDAGSQGT